MSSKYLTLPQVKFKEFRDLERRRVETSDMVWAVLVGSKLAVKTLDEAPNRLILLADEYPELPHVQRMNQRLDRAGQLLSDAENQICAMAFSLAFGLHEDFARSCLKILFDHGSATREDTNAKSYRIHETLADRTSHTIDADALALFHLTRKIRNAHLHAAGLVSSGLVSQYDSLTDSQRALWAELTGNVFQIPSIAEPATIGVPELIGALAVQKRLAYDINLCLQAVISREYWADMAVAEYLAVSSKRPKDPSFVRSVMGYLRGGFTALKLTEEEVSDAVGRVKKSEVL